MEGGEKRVTVAIPRAVRGSWNSREYLKTESFFRSCHLYVFLCIVLVLLSL